MALKDVFQEALDELGWEDEITHDDSDDTDFINTGYSIDGQSYRLTIITDERRQRMAVSMKCPIAIPKARQKDGAVVINALNVGLVVGNLEFPASGAVHYRWAIDVDGTTPSPEQIKVLVNAATGTFDELRVSIIGKVAFTKQSGEEIASEYWEAVEKLNTPSTNEDSGPTEL